MSDSIRDILKFAQRRFWAGRFADTIKERRVVIGGPFKGMSYVAESVGSQYWPKIFGTYECELWPAFKQLLKYPFHTIVDVGAAEGFYAIGCALRWRNAEVIAFESEAQGRDLISQMAASNHVIDRLNVRAKCDMQSLSEALMTPKDGPTFCIMDVEGAEWDLCNPESIPALRRSHLLVETHEFAKPGISLELRRRFAFTHDFQEFCPRPRLNSDFEGVPLLPRFVLGRSLIYLVDEWRHSNCTWLLMSPKRL